MRRLSKMTMLFILFSFFGVVTVLAVIYMNWIDVRQKAVSELGHVNNFVYSTFEGDLYKYESMLRLLGDQLATMNVVEVPENSRELLERTLKITPNLAGFGLARTDGRLFLLTNIAEGMPLPNLMANEQSRDTFLATLQSGKITLGRTYYMPLLGKWVLPLRVPIYGRDGDIAFVMTTGIDLLSTKNVWQPKNLPANISTLLVDDGFHVIFVSPLSVNHMPQWYTKPLPESTLKQIDPNAIRTPGAKVFDLYDRDGVRQLVMAVYHPEWQITSVTTIPYTSMVASLYERIRYLLIGIALFYGFSLAMYLIMNRHDKAKSRELLWNATHDMLTGLPNRFFLQEKAQQWCAKQRRFTALFMDLDNFKGVNDNYGHPFGDRLLTVISERLQRLVDPHEYVIRHGGDEFIILTNRAEGEIKGFVRRLRQAVGQAVTLDEIILHPSVSVGIARSPEDAVGLDMLLSKADLALYEAKQRKSGFFEYSPKLDEKAKQRYDLELHLRKAHLTEEFHVLFQPQLDAVSKELVGVEALARWRSPALGDVSPSSFIPIAEETAIIREIGAFVLEKACRNVLEIWEETGCRFRLSVNTSAEELLYGDFVRQLIAILEATGFPGQMLTIEVTESVFIRQVHKAKSVLNVLRQHGVGVSLDDFGTGYSSLSMLSGLPLTELKIDKSFITHIGMDDQRLAIVEAIVTLGQTLKLDVVAEGASEKQLELLRKMGCTVVQGYDYGVPMSAERLADYMRTYRAERGNV